MLYSQIKPDANSTRNYQVTLRGKLFFCFWRPIQMHTKTEHYAEGSLVALPLTRLGCFLT